MQWLHHLRGPVEAVGPHVSLKPFKEGKFINFERLAVVEMPAGPLLGCAAGMEDIGPVCRRQAGQIQFFKRRRGYRRNLAPVPHGIGIDMSSLAKLSISPIMPKLQSEQFSR